MPSKRIAFVANTSWSIYKFRLYLIRQLIEKGYSLYILAPRDAHTVHFENIPGLTYIELTKMRSKSLSVVHDLRLLRELTHHYRQIRPDLVFHYTIKVNIWGSIAAGRAGIPCVSVITGLGYAFAGGGWLQASAQVLYRWALRNSTEVWFLNEDDRRVFILKGLINEKKSFILPGEGVDTHKFAPGPASSQQPLASPAPTPKPAPAPEPSQQQTSSHSPSSHIISPPAPTPQQPTPSAPAPNAPPALSRQPAVAPGARPLSFLLIGRIIEHKGIREFVQAAEILQRKNLPVTCLLLGFFDEGNPVAISRQELREWETRGLIRYLGDTDDVSPFIREADCIVLPSWREGMPLSLLEGAAMAKALIATDVAGCRQIIRDGINGYLCKKKDGPDLAAKMEAFCLLSPESRSRMGEQGRADVLQHYTQELVANIYLGKITGFLALPPVRV